MSRNDSLTVRRVLAEIHLLEEQGIDPSDVLVSWGFDPDASWGEVTAMPADEMTEQMDSIGYDTDGMMTGSEYQHQYADDEYEEGDEDN